jgi:hypothetical protein
MDDIVKIPSRMLDLSSPLDNDTILDHPFMCPKIKYRSNVENAPMLLASFPGLQQEDLPDGEGWALESSSSPAVMARTWMRRRISNRRRVDGKRMMTIDEVPLDWFFRPGVKLDFRSAPDGHVVTAADCKALPNTLELLWRFS